MLGMIGFIALAIAVGVYAFTSHLYYGLAPTREKKLFVAAFSLLSATSIVWASTFLSPSNLVPALVFAADVTLVIATGCMIGLWVDLARPIYLLPFSLLGAALLTVRSYVAPSTAYISDGLLLFNLSQTESLIIGLIFLIVWLPGMVRFAYLALRSHRLIAYRNIVSFLFMSAILMTAFFLMARRPIMITLTFISIILLFLTMTGLNIVLSRIEGKQTNKKVPHG